MDTANLFSEHPDEGWSRSEEQLHQPEAASSISKASQSHEVPTHSQLQDGFWPSQSGSTATVPERHLTLVSNLDAISWQGVSFLHAFSMAILSVWLVSAIVKTRHAATALATTNRLTWQRFLRSHAVHVIFTFLTLAAPYTIRLSAKYNSAGQLAYDLPELCRVLSVLSLADLIRRGLVHIERRSIASHQLGTPSPRLVTLAAQAILHGWCAAGSTLAVAAAFRSLMGRAARQPASFLMRELLDVLPMVTSSRWMPPILVLMTYSLGTRTHAWIKHRGGLRALIRHGGTGDPLVLPHELATLFCALVSFEFLDPLVPTFDKSNLHLLPGAWAGVYLSVGALLAQIALDLTSHHHRVAMSAPGTPAQARSPKIVKRVQARSPSLTAQARQLPHANSDDFANPPPVSPTLQRRVILERFSPGKPQPQPTRYHEPAAARQQGGVRFEQIASNESLSLAPRSPSPAKTPLAELTRSLSPQLATRFREPSPVRLVGTGLFATQRRGENQQDAELKVSTPGSMGAAGSLKGALKSLGNVFGSGDVSGERRGRSPARS